MDMDYGHINIFLEKFKKIFKDKTELKSLVLEIINKNLNSKIDESCISIKPPFINIKGSPILKNEVLIYKVKILKEIEEKTKDIILTDIK